LVIGADTVVACEGRILGKPKGEEDAKRMLRLLQGKSHYVYTGVTLCRHGALMEEKQPCFHEGTAPDGKTEPMRQITFHEVTRVDFFPMTEQEIQEYIDTGDVSDKAGAYGIQGFCARYIKGVEGDYNNVVGLPIGRLYQRMKELCGFFY
jgi:septum formation protein